MATLKENVDALNQEIQNGNILGAFEKYYADDCVMQENDKEPRKGKEANREYEKNFVEAVDQWHDAKVLSVTTDEKNGVASVEWFMDFTFKGGQRAARSQVCVQKWEDGQIVKERFYYAN